MDLTFLGTSSGTPTKARNVTALAMQEDSGKTWHLIDCGEGTQRQILRTPLSLSRLTTIFITHIHGDHCYGLPGLLASAAMQGKADTLLIVAPQGIEAWLQATVQHTQLYLPYPLQFLATESLRDASIGGFKVNAVELSHRVPSFAYVFTEEKMESRLNSEKLDADGIPRGTLWGDIKRGQDVEVNGKRINSADYLIFDRAPRKLVIGGDNDSPGLLTNACQDCDLLIHEATFTEDIALKSGALYGHSSAKQVAAFAQQAEVPNLILTHFSPRYQADPNKSPSIEDVRKEALAHYRGNLVLAEDFATYRLDKNGALTQKSREEKLSNF